MTSPDRKGGNGSSGPVWFEEASEPFEDDDLPHDPTPAQFPTLAATAVGVLVAVHLGILAWTRSDLPLGRAMFHAGVLLRDRVAFEPWRVPASMLLHVDVRHVLANALGTAAFGVPLVSELGLARAAGLYVLSGVGGGVAAVLLGSTGTAVLGSSGAVAGLFGAWAVLKFHRDASETLPGRARLRTLGVALLVLPSFLSPMTPQGQPVSVASHLGGLATGMAIGAAIARSLVDRIRERRAMS